MSGTIIVTGGARGIGAAIAQGAAARGYAVCVNYAERRDRAEAVVAAIQTAGGVAIAVQADVRDTEAVAAMFAQAEAELGTLTALVNNAGITGHLTTLADADIDEVRQVLETNVLGSLICAREAVRRMAKGRGGTGGVIVNITSRAAQHGSAGEFVHYAASKAAVESFSFGLAGEVAADGIRVNCVSAGLVETELHAAMGDPTRPQRFASRIPMGRAGTPNEIANAVLWLLSDEASYCTGAVLAVAGGR